MPKQLTRDLLSNCCSQLSSSIKEELDRDSFACARRPVRPTGFLQYCTDNNTISLYICTVTWTVFAAVG